MTIKTIDINALEWFDRINGNSYFAGTIILNYQMEDEKRLVMPFQYGYGDQYVHEAKAMLHEHNYISGKDNEALWRYCEQNGVILRTSKQKNCKKRELKNLS